ncbi:MAG: CotH kinase family protein [Bacteroidales bacterium]|nr:CotH kinase family protein [Bacteroidales bacterium]
MFKGLKYGLVLLAACTLLAGCRKTIIPKGQPEPGERVYTGCIPQNPDKLPRFYLDLPEGWELSDIRKNVWTEGCSVHIQASENGVESTVFTTQGAKVKGHGNSTFRAYPKKPLTVNFYQQVNFLGTGKTKHWVLLANWMDRTLLRNDIAFELARHTSLEWTSTGTFVELYVNNEYRGVYWLGEKVHAEGSHFKCDYFYSFDTSDKEEHDFDSEHGHWKKSTRVGGIPVELKYPDRDDYTPQQFNTILTQAKNALYGIEDAIMRGDKPSSVMDMNTLCDFYLIQEVCGNGETQFPKSTFLYYRDGKLYWGPVWDFDYGTFTPEHHGLPLKSTLYYYQLWTHPEFKSHLKHRWSILKPVFKDVVPYIDKRAAYIREAEKRNHEMWPCFPNPLAEDPSGLLNGDETLSFDDAVALIKKTLLARIEEVDMEISRL